MEKKEAKITALNKCYSFPDDRCYKNNGYDLNPGNIEVLLLLFSEEGFGG